MARDKIIITKNELFNFFVMHLNKVYAAKKRLVSELPDILDNVCFSDLREGILETIEDVERQIDRMVEIYALIDADISDGNCNGLIGLIEDSFKDIKLHSHDPELRDMSILFYLQNIESMEMASFQVLQMLAVKLKNERIKRLIKENYDDAKAGRTLLLLITAKYIAAAEPSH